MAAGDGFDAGRGAECVRCGITYPCPLTTSSFASCLQLLQVPIAVSALALAEASDEFFRRVHTMMSDVWLLELGLVTKVGREIRSVRCGGGLARHAE